MQMNRLSLDTNGFSEKVENHANAVALHYMFYKLRQDS